MKELKPCLPLQIFALDAEIFKFKKGLIYANEMNGDVIHVSSQSSAETIETFCYHDNFLFSRPHQLDFNMLVILARKYQTRPRI